jgi:hypothetical protein
MMCDEQTVLEFSESLTRAREANMTRQEFPKRGRRPGQRLGGFSALYARTRAREGLWVFAPACAREKNRLSGESEALAGGRGEGSITSGSLLLRSASAHVLRHDGVIAELQVGIIHSAEMRERWRDVRLVSGWGGLGRPPTYREHFSGSNG